MPLKPAMHGRDHCPGGADPIPCLQNPGAVAQASSINTSVTSGADVTCEFDNFWSSDTDILDSSPNQAAGDTLILIKKPGNVAVWASAEDGATSVPWRLLLVVNNTNLLSETYTWMAEQQADDSTLNYRFISAGYAITAPIFTNASIELTVTQDSGSPHTLATATVLVQWTGLTKPIAQLY